MASTAATTETERQAPIGMNNLAKYGLFAILAASVTNALVGLIALGVSDSVTGFGGLGWAPIIGFSALSAVAATVVYGVLTRFSNRPNRTFTIIATVVLILSYVPFNRPPEGLAGAPQSVFLTLGVMHVTAAVVIVGILSRASETVEETP